MSSELISALDQLEKEKHIGKETIIGAIEESLVGAASKDYGKTAITKVNMDRETGEITVWLEKTVVEEVEDPVTEVSLEEAKKTEAAAVLKKLLASGMSADEILEKLK